MKRNVYLNEVPLDEAVRRFFDALEGPGAIDALPGEPIAVDVAAMDRITAEPVFARISSPHHHACAMDGVAVKSAHTFAASERRPVTLRLGEDAVMADTGDPLPFGFDAVIMIEDLVETTDDSVTIIAPAKPWQHVRTVGEDIVATELVLPENHAIRAVDIGAMLAAGVTQVQVRRRPRVAVIPTGDELVAPGSKLQTGDIVEFNSRIIGGLVSEWGGEVMFHDIVRDDLSDYAGCATGCGRERHRYCERRFVCRKRGLHQHRRGQAGRGHRARCCDQAGQADDPRHRGGTAVHRCAGLSRVRIARMRALPEAAHGQDAGAPRGTAD